MTIDTYNINDILADLEKRANSYITEKSFYTTYDERVLKSYVEDIDNGDNFADYCNEFFELLEKEGYYD